MGTCQIEQVAARKIVSSLHIKPLIQVQLFPPSNTINTEVIIETNKFKCLTMKVTACVALYHEMNERKTVFSLIRKTKYKSVYIYKPRHAHFARAMRFFFFSKKKTFFFYFIYNFYFDNLIYKWIKQFEN